MPDGVSCVTAIAVGAEGGVFSERGARATAATGVALGASTFAVVAGSPAPDQRRWPGRRCLQFRLDPGAAGAAGVNGGGAGGLATVDGTSGYFPGAGGGGASDVRVGGADLDRRVVVGGGGGGGSAGSAAPAAPVSAVARTAASALVESGASGGTGGSQSAGGTGGSTNGVGPTGVDGAFGVGGTGGGGDAVNGGGGGGGGGLVRRWRWRWRDPWRGRGGRRWRRFRLR